MSTPTIDALDAIAARNTHRPVPYLVTDAGHEALTAAGPACPRWQGGRPCLRDAGHRGRCSACGGRTKARRGGSQS